MPARGRRLPAVRADRHRGSDPQKALAFCGIVGRGDHLGRDSNGGERVLELVRDVARERFEQLDVGVQPARQLLERAREVADLVFSIDAAEAGWRGAAVRERKRGAGEGARAA